MRLENSGIKSFFYPSGLDQLCHVIQECQDDHYRRQRYDKRQGVVICIAALIRTSSISAHAQTISALNQVSMARRIAYLDSCTLSVTLNIVAIWCGKPPQPLRPGIDQAQDHRL